MRAFTANGEHGNPAGVVLEAEDLSATERQVVAARAGFSETAFVSSTDEADYAVNFFTPTTEVDLCGHATIATWALLNQLGKVAAGRRTQATRAGVLSVEIALSGRVFMEQTASIFDNRRIARETAADLLGIREDEVHDNLPVQIVSTGLRDVLVPLKEKAILSRLRPDLPAIADFSRKHNCSGMHVFSLLPESESIAAARNFAPADGIPEECATGTSNGALLCYLRQHGALSQADEYRIEQGEAMGQRSYIYGKFQEEIVWVGGLATRVGERQL
jgi:PhzF family phenazine biosynthesis protein